MKFDKEKFSEVLIKIKDSYGSINQMAEKTGITSAYISKLIRLMYDNSPSPDILWKLSSNSNGIVTYFDLMEICGYIKEQDINIEIYSDKIFQKILSFSDSQDTVKIILNNFITYTNDLKDSLVFKNGGIVKEISYYINFKTKIFKPFIILHNAFIELLLNRKKINKSYANLYLQNSEIYDDTIYMNNDFNIKLFRYNPNMKLQNKNIQEIIDLLWLYSITIRYSYLSYFSDNQENIFTTYEEPLRYYMCPIYQKISSDEPYFLDENITGRIVLDTSLYNIRQEDDYFSLEVDKNYSNFKDTHGHYIIFQKQDIATDNNIILVTSNNILPTIKKYKRVNDNLVMLQPIDLQDILEPIVVDIRNEKLQVLGVAIGYFGKMEMK